MANHNQRSQFNHKSAFTIAEMIMVMGIMAVLATVGTRTYFTETNRFEFNNALIKSMQLVKTVRGYATTNYPIYVEKIKKNIIPLDGYGIKAELDKVTKRLTLTTFANVGSGTELITIQKDNDPNTMDASDVVIETYQLPTQIKFRYFFFDDAKRWIEDKQKPENTGPNAFVSYVVFKPPLGNMTTTGMDGENQIGLNELTLQFENPSTDSAGQKKCQKITINKVKTFPELTYQPEC